MLRTIGNFIWDHPFYSLAIYAGVALIVFIVAFGLGRKPKTRHQYVRQWLIVVFWPWLVAMLFMGVLQCIIAVFKWLRYFGDHFAHFVNNLEENIHKPAM